MWVSLFSIQWVKEYPFLKVHSAFLHRKKKKKKKKKITVEWTTGGSSIDLKRIHTVFDLNAALCAKVFQ